MVEGAWRPEGAPLPWLVKRRAALLLLGLFFGSAWLIREPGGLLEWHVKVEASMVPAGTPPPLPRALLRHFVVATPTASHRHALVKTMRGWRRGLRTLVLTNATGAELAAEQAEGRRHGEVWQHYPDVHGFLTNKSGDARAAMVPMHAAARLGAFKWMLYADDDVAFLWPGVLRMLAGLDPDDPYFLSDSYWGRWSAKGAREARERGTRFNGTRSSRPPKLNQPRCVPCTFNDSGLDLGKAFVVKTCDCTVDVMAAAFKEPLAGHEDWLNFPAGPPIISIAGAGGAVLSAGLLRRLDVRRYSSCVAGNESHTGGPTTCGGGDCLLTRCLWHQGWGYTDPGFQLRHKKLHPEMFVFNGARSNWTQLARWMADALVGACPPVVPSQASNCSRLWLDHMVSVHTAGANMTDYAADAARVSRFLRLAALLPASLAPLEGLVGRLVRVA